MVILTPLSLWERVRVRVARMSDWRYDIFIRR